MARIELSVMSSYVPNWGVYEAIREFLQNLRDAKVMHGCEIRVRHDARTNKLTMVNVGKTMDTRALLLGFTSKAGVAGAAGKFGEGLDLALLTLARLGHEVWIHTGDETWTPKIERSSAFGGEEVLVIWTRKVAPKNEVRVEVSGIDAVAWEEMKPRFLFLGEKGKSVETSNARVLMHPDYQGCMYVKGIFVQRLDDLSYGYDFDTLQVDRDRKMVDIFEAKWESTAALMRAAAQNDAMQDSLYRSLKEGRTDGAGGGDYTDARVRAGIVKRFRNDHGENAIAVTTEEMAKELRYVGGNAVVVKQPLADVLTPDLGTYSQARAKLVNSAATIVQTTDLTPAERNVLGRAIAAVWAHTKSEIALPFAVVFPAGTESLAGMVTTSWVDGASKRQIQIARHQLGRLVDAIGTLIHEVAHIESDAGDNDARHTRAIERLWSAVYETAAPS